MQFILKIMMTLTRAFFPSNTCWSLILKPCNLQNGTLPLYYKKFFSVPVTNKLLYLTQDFISFSSFCKSWHYLGYYELYLYPHSDNKLVLLDENNKKKLRTPKLIWPWRDQKPMSGIWKRYNSTDRIIHDLVYPTLQIL